MEFPPSAILLAVVVAVVGGGVIVGGCPEMLRILVIAGVVLWEWVEWLE